MKSSPTTEKVIGSTMLASVNTDHMAADLPREIVGSTSAPPEEVYFFHARGTGMEPWIRDGQFCCAERVTRFTDGDRYAISYDGVNEFVKRVRRKSNRRLVIASDNRSYPEQEVEHIEGNEYRDVETGESLTIFVHGRVVDPPDTGRATYHELVASLAEVIQQMSW